MRRRSFGMVQDRVHRNMRSARWTSKKETFLTGIASGLVILAFGVVVLIINIQNVASPAVPLITTLLHLPIIVLVIGGGLTLFGLYWTMRNTWRLVSLLKANKSAK
jgi:uncharacterized integral membrane protein